MFNKAQLNGLLAEAAAKDNGRAVDPDNALQVFRTYWPLTRKILGIVQIFTGQKVDEAITRIIVAGDELTKKQ